VIDAAALRAIGEGFDGEVELVPPAGHVKVLHKFNLRICVQG
jgi:hypothetical protein